LNSLFSQNLVFKHLVMIFLKKNHKHKNLIQGAQLPIQTHQMPPISVPISLNSSETIQSDGSMQFYSKLTNITSDLDFWCPLITKAFVNHINSCKDNRLLSNG
jgi:hypothetical protein